MPQPKDNPVRRRLGRSKILRILGPGMFAPCTAVSVPGTVAWCNFDLARSMGFRVPRANRMSAALHDELVAAFSYRLLPQADAVAGRRRITLFADRYGGEGIGDHRGSARGAMYPWGELFLKGIGPTPLRRDHPDAFHFSHGGLHLWHGLYVAALGELCGNLFAGGSTRILAVIDQGDDTVFPSGERVPRGIEVRVGSHLRLAHLLLRRDVAVAPAWKLFVAMTRASGQLVMSRASWPRRPDVRATMRRILDVQARAAAEHARWRLPHVGMSPSNLQWDGALLDLAQARTNPRALPMVPEPFVPSTWIPRSDYMERVDFLRLTYGAIRRSLGKRQMRRLGAGPLRVAAEFEHAYRGHLDIELMRAAGIKRVAAQRIRREAPALARAFADTLAGLSALANPAATGRVRVYDERAAVADVFAMLRILPARYFRNPRRDLTDTIRAGLRLVHAGSRRRVARRKRACAALIADLARLYPEIMQTCRRVALRDYRTVAAMERSIRARAEFENRPIEDFYFDAREKAFTGAALRYRKDASREALRRLTDAMLGRSLRDVDALLTRGPARRLGKGRWELQARTIAGIYYSVLASNARGAGCRLQVRFVAKRRRGGFLPDLPGAPVLTLGELRGLRYVYSVDGWTTQRVARGRARRTRGGKVVMSFAEVRSGVPYGMLEGYFVAGRGKGRVIDDGGEPFRGYAFALPDDAELAWVIAARWASRPLIEALAEA
jgi:hypothetical protein